MKIGDKVWLFDFNRRVYPKEHTMSSSPIYAEHFYQAVIEAETSRSWIVNGEKFNKNNPLGIYTDEQKADKIWDNSNRYSIIEKIRYSQSIDKLKAIAKILEE